MANISLPSVTSLLPNDLRNWIQRVREALTGFVTPKDLADSGVVALDNRGNMVAVAPPGFNDFTPPPAPTGLVASSAITTIMLQWDDPHYPNLAYAEIWRSGTSDLGAAVSIGITSGCMYADSVEANSDFYYWVRLVSRANVTGAYNAVSGVHGLTSVDPAGLIDILTANNTYGDVPFYYQPTSITIDGVVIPAGTYFRTTYMADLSVTRGKFANLAVDDSKIANCTVNKLTSGTITGQTITISYGGCLKLDQTAFNTGSGFWLGKGSDGWVRMSLGSPTGHGLNYDESAGILNYRGVMTFTSGSSGYANLGDKPTSLASINSTEGSKLGGIASGATVGAPSGSYVGGVLAQNVGGWAHGSDTTKIDGGDIYAGSVTAQKMAVSSISSTTGEVIAINNSCTVTGDIIATGNVKAGNITELTSAFGSPLHLTSSPSYVALCTVAISSPSGATGVLVTMTALITLLSGSGNCFVYVWITKNGNSRGAVFPVYGYVHTVTFTMFWPDDNNSSQTYVLAMGVGGGSTDVYVYNSELTVLGAKR